MISPLLGGPDRVVAVTHLDSAPARTALFSRREIRRVLDVLDALDPDDQRIEIAILPYSAPVLVARPRDPVGDAWVAVAGHIEVPDETPVAQPPITAPAPRPAPPQAPKDEPLPKQETKTWSGGDPRPLKAEETPAPASAPAAKKEEGGTCEGCGSPVTKTQKQMSQLFLNKTLCKACMDKATGKGVSA